MQIQINDQYAIKSDQYSWQIAEKRARTRDGDTVVEWCPFLWFSSLDKACGALAERSLRTSGAQSLTQAIAQLDRIVAELCTALHPQFEVRRIATNPNESTTSRQTRAKTRNGPTHTKPLPSRENAVAGLCSGVHPYPTIEATEV